MRYSKKHFNYAFKPLAIVSRKTKKYMRKYYDEMFDDMEEDDPFLLMCDLPDCEECKGKRRVDYGYPYDPWNSYDCPECEGTGKYGWEYDKDRNKVRMKEFIKPSNNAIRLKRTGVLKKGEGRESIPKEDTNAR
ncbi:hypothetical protein P4H27_26025 [Paenibacillus taichungensis]|uniref:hypothetical protein n=1 Tax=Paenibacillus taichungensis TaxID=484184 RepID=UPI002DB918C3|nr:hypothetical protein [Paenibacillus taichungensis]MEC0110432.1 hypothetical protein [Paenibacillus taichungensis]MEC0200108.1 hypothetical protein [Paenibacillus taichungensis]